MLREPKKGAKLSRTIIEGPFSLSPWMYIQYHADHPDFI